MKIYVHVNASAEPRAFHGENESSKFFHAVHVAPEVCEKNAVDDDYAKKIIEDFLKTAPSFKFVLVDLKNKKIFGEIDPEAAGGTLTGGPTWLEKRKPESADPDRPYYWTKAEAPATGYEFDADALSAALLLRGTLDWIGPVPEWLGLTRLIKTDDLGAWNDFAVIPYSGTKPTTLNSVNPVQDQNTFDIEYDLGVELNGIRTITARAVPLSKLSKPWKKMNDDGTVTASADDPAFRSALKRIEEESAALLWPMPHLIEPLFFESSTPGGDIEKKEIDWSALQNRQWLADMGLRSAIDPLIWALAMPTDFEADNSTYPRGQIMLPFIASIAAANEELKYAAGDSPDKAWRLWRPRLVTNLPKLEFSELEQILRTIDDVDGAALDLIKTLQAGIEPDVSIPALERILPLRSALVEVVTAMQEENVVEALIIALLEHIRDQSGLSEEEKNAFKLGMLGFRKLLDEGINGAEALRRTISGIVSRELVHEAGADLGKLDDELSRAKFFARRYFTIAGNSVLDSLLNLLKTDAEGSPPAELENALVKRYEAVAKRLVAGPEATARFLPDKSPQPLPIRILPGMEAKTLEGIGSFIQGFGIVVAARKIQDGTATEIVGHGNLVEAKLNYDKDDGGEDLVVTAVQPLIPGLVDKRPNLFAEYEGRPLAGAAQTGIGAHNAIEDETQRMSRELAEIKYYALEEASETALLPPDLAYGVQYAASAFWIPNSGRLPHGMRDSMDPAKPAAPTGKFKPTIGSNTPRYLRRTTISETGLSEPAAEKRISVVPDDVFPLASDYPRIAVSTDKDTSAYIDIFRNSDGTGALKYSVEEITLRDVVLSGSVKSVKLVRHWDARGTSNGLMLDGTLKGDGSDGTLAVKDDPNKRDFWIRIILNANKTTEATLSFADPSDQADIADKPATAPLLLVADGAAWRDKFTDEASIELSLPRVSFADFERWAANQALFEASTQNTDADLPQCLLVAWMMRHLSKKITDMIDRLPDPAVSGWHLALQVTDTMDGKFPAPTFLTVPKRPYESVKCNDILVALNAVEIADDKTRNDAAQELIEKLERLLTDLDQGAQRVIKVASGSFGFDNAGTKISVPEGHVAHFSARPFVRRMYSDTSEELHAMEPRLRELSTGALGDDVVFPGTALQIEAMQAEALELSEPDRWWEASRVVPQGQAREYHLELDLEQLRSKSVKSDDYNFWRQYGQADLATQRWRPTGRPIYHWIKPVEAAGSSAELRGPVVPLDSLARDPDKKPGLFEFENDAFDRNVTDSDIVRIRLGPVHQLTHLKTFQWNAPSATAYRHRIDLRSRYWGALSSPKARGMIDSENEEEPWTNRAVVLADLGALDLTRPQVRTLLPLTRRPSEVAMTPPITCLLAEKPFDQAGLADRIAAEIETVEKFAFFKLKKSESAPDEAGEDVRLALKNLRKEVGPDPRLTYYGIDDVRSQRYRLRCEGPVGLHFEQIDAVAPAFTNAQYLLHPQADSIDTGSLEENFIGVSVRRYLDPDWCWSSAPLTEKGVPDVWWQDLQVDTDIDQFRIEQTFTKAPEEGGGTEVSPILWFDKILKGNEVIEVRALMAVDAIYPTPGDFANAPKAVVLCRVPKQFRIGVMSQRLDGRRYAFSVFISESAVSQEQIIENGASGVPTLLASIDWTSKGEVSVKGPERQPRRLTRASSATFVEWARTGRDFHRFVATPLTDSGKTPKVLGVPEIDALWSQKDGTIRLKSHTLNDADIRLSSPSANTTYPLHVQRRLALLLTRVSPTLGRELSQFDRMLLSDGSGVQVKENSPGDGAALRVVEYETRAEILASNLTTTLERYKKAYFDRIAVGAGTSRQEGDTVRFHLRLTNTALAKGSDLALTLTSANDAGKKAELKLTDTSPEPLTAVDIVLRKSEEKETWTLAALGLTANGSTQLKENVTLNNLDFLSEGESGFWVGMFSKETDLWADLSVLFSVAKLSQTGKGLAEKNTENDAFDFDWLFTTDKPPQSSVEAVLPHNLSRMSEAQARLVAISDPIIIRKL